MDREYYAISDGTYWMDGGGMRYTMPILWFEESSPKRAIATLKGRIRGHKWWFIPYCDREKETEESLLEEHSKYKIVKVKVTIV